jgi:hypothetical protein
MRIAILHVAAIVLLCLPQVASATPPTPRRAPLGAVGYSYSPANGRFIRYRSFAIVLLNDGLVPKVGRLRSHLRRATERPVLGLLKFTANDRL